MTLLVLLLLWHRDITFLQPLGLINCWAPFREKKLWHFNLENKLNCTNWHLRLVSELYSAWSNTCFSYFPTNQLQPSPNVGMQCHVMHWVAHPGQVSFSAFCVIILFEVMIIHCCHIYSKLDSTCHSDSLVIVSKYLDL